MPIADDEVIEYPHIHQRQCLLQAARDQLVRLAGFQHAGGVVVREYQCRRVVQQSLPQYLSRMHAGPIDGAAKELFEGNEPVTVIEVQAA